VLLKLLVKRTNALFLYFFSLSNLELVNVANESVLDGGFLAFVAFGMLKNIAQVAF
jgi:hypothetical protein